MLDLPQTAIDPVIYYALICGLFAALSWNALSLLQGWLRRRQGGRSRS